MNQYFINFKYEDPKNKYNFLEGQAFVTALTYDEACLKIINKYRHATDFENLNID